VFRKGPFSEQLQKGVSQGNPVAASKGFWETHLLFAPLLIASRYPVSHG
jgi:hypothetical protein